MEEFLNRLYNYEYFGTYLMISIAVLILLFIIILIFGKKDQKTREIEETKKLQQINNENTFKEDSIPQNVQVPNNVISDNTLVNEIPVVGVNEAPVVTPEVVNAASTNPLNSEVVEPQINTNVNNIEPQISPIETLDSPVINPVPPVENVLDNTPVDTPILSVNNTVENTPVVPEVDALENVSIPTPEVSASITPTVEMPQEVDVVMPKVEESSTGAIFAKEEEKPFAFSTDTIVNNEEQPQELKAFNYDEIVNSIKENESQVEMPSFREPIFSSVYAPEREKVEEHNEVVEEDDEEIELPTLKKEVIEEKIEPVVNNYNIDDLTGETYTINR